MPMAASLHPRDEEWALVLSHRSRGTTGRARRTVKNDGCRSQPQPRLGQAKACSRTRTGAQPDEDARLPAPTAAQQWAPFDLT